ncbi:hypothetical protein ACFWYW_53275 [Nonomuraea sp. NPDC059023]|uniref:hypothetical protein n=1 Tax=unclassified Nonomuraea TaxID=2593643 RepID=UPI0036BDCEA2
MHILDLLTSVLQLAAAGAGLYAGAVLALKAAAALPLGPPRPGTRGPIAVVSRPSTIWTYCDSRAEDPWPQAQAEVSAESAGRRVSAQAVSDTPG